MLVTSLIGLTFLRRGSVLTVITLQLLNTASSGSNNGKYKYSYYNVLTPDA
jgi:hypothetical protein